MYLNRLRLDGDVFNTLLDQLAIELWALIITTAAHVQVFSNCPEHDGLDLVRGQASDLDVLEHLLNLNYAASEGSQRS